MAYFTYSSIPLQRRQSMSHVRWSLFLFYGSYFPCLKILPWNPEDILWIILKVLLFCFLQLGLKSWNSFFVYSIKDIISSSPCTSYLSNHYWIPIFSLLICNDISSICQVPICNMGLFLGSQLIYHLVNLCPYTAVLIIIFLLYLLYFSSLTPMEV